MIKTWLRTGLAGWLAGCIVSVGLAQTPVRVRVQVLDSLTGQPVSLAHVQWLTPRRSSVSNEQGLTKPALFSAGPTGIRVSHIAYEHSTFRVSPRTDTVLQLRLIPYRRTLAEVVVRGNSDAEAVRSADMSAVRLTARQIENNPSIGGEKDVIKTLLLLPGVKSESEGSSNLNVRGGGADQNLLLFNGITLYSSNHLFGLLSTFNADVIQDVSLLKGAFPAQYGGRLSSVLSVNSRDGDYRSWRARTSVSLLAARALVEGPLIANKVSLLVAGRRTYIDLLFPPQYNSKEPVTTFSFYDLNTRLSWRLNATDKLTAFAYADRDQLRSTQVNGNKGTNDTTRLTWRNRLGSLRWERYRPGQYSMQTQLSLSDYGLTLASRSISPGSDVRQQFQTAIRDISLRWTLEPLAGRQPIRYGGNYTYRRFLPNDVQFEARPDTPEIAFSSGYQSLHELALFADHTADWTTRWRTVLGLRLNLYQAGRQTYISPEPRLSARYLLNEQSSLKLSYTRMQQVVHLLSNPGLGIPIDLWVPASRQVPPETAQQVAAGYQRTLTRAGLSLSVEAYYKTMTGVISYKDGKSSADVVTVTTDGGWDQLIAQGTGWASGLEVLLEKKQGRVTGWVGYTLAYTRQQFADLNQGRAFFPRYDRRHEVSMVANWQLNHRWAVNASWVFGTGQPVTVPLQAAQIPGYSLLTGQIPKTTDGVLVVQGERNSLRMIPFHRLNVAVQRTGVHRWGQTTLELGLYNAYNRQNPFYYYLGPDNKDVLRLKSLSLFPVLPGFAYSVQFRSR